MRTTPIRTLAGVLAAVAVLVAACGSDDDAGGTVTAVPEETTGTSDDTATASSVGTTLEEPGTSSSAPDAAGVPERIVSLSPTHTEMLFAIGAGDLLVAVDEFSNHPPEALELPNELSGFEPNVEAIAAFDPDLVVIGGDFTGLGDQLDVLGIGWWDGPAALTIEDTYRQIEELGEITGHAEEAGALVVDMQADIEEIVASTPVPDEPLTYYHELDPTYFTADSTTFIGAVYGLLGLENIADEAGGDSGGFPQLSAEFVVAEDPDMIFLADTLCCGETAASVAERPGWRDMAAVVEGDVVEMNDDIASRWGPRIVDYLADVSAAVAAAQD